MALTVTHKFVSLKPEQPDPTIIGPNEWNSQHVVNDSSANYVANDYNFTPQSPGGTLVVGSNTIILNPPPQGLSNGDTLYVSGGIGTAECVTIQGWNATTGQLIINCGNTHTGTWTIGSSSGGIQEAIIALSTSSIGGQVIINKPITQYCTVNVVVACTISGTQQGLITWAGSNSVGMFSVYVDNVIINGLNVNGGVALSIIGTVGTRNNLKIINCTILGSQIPIYIQTPGSYYLISNNYITGFSNAGVNLYTSLNTSYVIISNNYIDSTSATATYSGCIACWGNFVTISGNYIKSGGGNDGGIVCLNNAGAGAHSCKIVNNTIEVAGPNAFEPIGVGSMMNFIVSGNIIKITATVTRAGFIGIEINESLYGIVSNNTFFGGNNIANNANIIFVESSCYVDIVDNVILGWASDHSNIAILLLQTNNISSHTSNQLSYNLVANNIIYNTSLTVAVTAVKIDTLTTGNVIGNVIKNNLIHGNGVATSTGVTVYNSAVANCDRNEISYNFLENWDTGILIGETDSWIIDNRFFSCTTNILDSSSASKIRQLADTAILTLASATTLTLNQNNATYYITGTTTVTAINTGWLGRQIKFIKTDAGSVTIGGGGNIPGTHTLAQYGSLILTFDGSNWY